jgi:16S rRNA (cytidine1402-2'-O)-methyltransferase
MTVHPLLLVATPIGNLADLSPRASEALRQADIVFAEDTRRTRPLLARIGGAARLVSLHEHNETARAVEVVERLRAGERCVVVTDAGTPAVSDPGARVVRAVADAGLDVRIVPGPSAVTAAAALAGFGADRFLFLGFPPRRGTARDRWIDQLVGSACTAIAFESPRRIGRLLADLVGRAGMRNACVCREITKLHEEVRRGTVEDLADYYSDATVRGEVVLVLEGRALDEERDGTADAGQLEESARRHLQAGDSTRRVAEKLQREHGMSRNAAYDLALRAGEDLERERGRAGTD